MSEIQDPINIAVESPTGVTRRRFIQGAAAASAGAAVIGLTACGGDDDDSGASVGINGTTLRIATGKQVHPAAPWETSDGSLFILSNVGEWLCYQAVDGTLEPRIAESWEANADATSWTFNIRQGVMFNDGTPLTVDDIVYTFTSIFTADPSRSKGIFDGTLLPEGVVKVDENTVRFDLLKPTGNFPYSVGSTSYGMCIIKNGADGGKVWTEDMISAGPWKMESYIETEKTMFVKNEFYWDSSFNPEFERLELVQFVSLATVLPQLNTGEIDFATGINAPDALALDPNEFTIGTVKAGAGFAHVHMRCNFGPFMDKRIRQAAALTLDREGYVAGVLSGIGGVVGNDSVMDPYPTKDTSVPQRTKDIEAAKALMAEAGVPEGFDVQLSTWARDDINNYAEFIKTSFAEIGINVELVIDGSDGGGSVYYTYDPYPSARDTVFEYDNNSWLASNLGIVDWAGRGVPDQYLLREWRSSGDWSGAGLWDDNLDAAIDEYISATTSGAQKVASKKIQEISLDQTPYILAYTSNLVTAGRKGLEGVEVNGMGQIDARNARNA